MAHAMLQGISVKMPNLRDFIGQTIQVFLVNDTLKDDPDNNDAARMKLTDIESSGIWVESLKMNALMLARSKQSIPITPIFFVPFSQILFVSASDDYPLLSPRELGLEEK